MGTTTQQTEQRSFASPDDTREPPGHDAWVIGDEPVVVIDWWGASHYAKEH